MRYLILLLFFFYAKTTFAQVVKPFEGEVHFKLEISGGGEETELVRQFMPSGFVYVLKGDNVLIKTLGTNAGMMGNVVYNAKTDRAFVVQEALKTVYMIKPTEKQAASSEDVSNVLRVADGASPKNIAGYQCKHFIISMGDAEGSDTEIWVTEAIQVTMPQSLGSNMPIDQKIMSMVKGFPLAMKMSGPDGLRMELEAVKIDKKGVSNSVFDLPKDYEIKTFEPTLNK